MNSLPSDIRELICLDDVMEELGLGPNGGLIYCMEYPLRVPVPSFVYISLLSEEILCKIYSFRSCDVKKKKTRYMGIFKYSMQLVHLLKNYQLDPWKCLICFYFS